MVWWYHRYVWLEKNLAFFFKWLANTLSTILQFEGHGMMALIVILTLSVSVRYLFASGGAYVAAMVPVFATSRTCNRCSY